MRDTEYAYGVARIRANEPMLFSASDIQRLLSSADYADAMRIFAEKGWKMPENSADFSAMLENESVKTWQLLTESVPDTGEIETLIVTNDFFNLKAALKAWAARKKAFDFFLRPAVTESSLIEEAVEKNEYGLLPDYLRSPAEQAYDAIVRLNNPGLADIALDVAALNTKRRLSEKAGDTMLSEITSFFCAAANIKTAARCAKTGRDREYTVNTLCDSGMIDNDELAEAALAGEERLAEYLSASFYEEAGEHLKRGLDAFEKWCDDTITQKVQAAKFTALGMSPIIAYFIHKEMEIKNARIILSAKQNRLPADIVRQRVRAVYV
mgnify:CR=1 FL=1